MSHDANTPLRLLIRAEMASSVGARANDALASLMACEQDAKGVRDVALNRMLRECSDALERIIQRTASVNLRLRRKAQPMEGEAAHVAR